MEKKSGRKPGREVYSIRRDLEHSQRQVSRYTRRIEELKVELRDMEDKLNEHAMKVEEYQDQLDIATEQEDNGDNGASEFASSEAA